MKKKVKQKKENGERWLLTYADMITLLLALFIVLYAISNVDQAKFHSLAEALNQSLGDGNGTGVFDGNDGILDGNGNTIHDYPYIPTPAPNSGKTTIGSKDEMKNLEEGVDNIIDDLNITDAVGTGITDRGLTITFSNDALFDSGSATLKQDLMKGLETISKFLNRVNNAILIEGYTDNIPLSSTSIYSSNWQLSAARSANVAEFLAKKDIAGDRLSPVGYGEYHPKATNSTVEGRKKNRRVEITVLYGNTRGVQPTKAPNK